jgi:three-Cys-motif partner protein
MSDAPLIVAPDGLYTPTIKRHSLEKIRLHNRYARIFATAMRAKWPQLGYVGLYAGAGRARVDGTSDVVETSALAVVRQPDPFTHYVYVDNNADCVDALRPRIALVQGSAEVTILCADVNESADAVLRALPTFSRERGLLCFCFVDPFDLQLRFSTIRRLAERKMDFLVLLMLGVDGRRNFRRYLVDQNSSRIGDLIDSPLWREEFKPNDKVLHFLLTRFDVAMQRLGYLSAAEDAHAVNAAGMGVLQYVLAFYSQNELGKKFWKETRSSLAPQLGFSFDRHDGPGSNAR